VAEYAKFSPYADTGWTPGVSQTQAEQAVLLYGHSTDTENVADIGGHGIYQESGINTGEKLAASQGFEPRYADPESNRISKS
jgi:hypothetical protein